MKDAEPLFIQNKRICGEDTEEYQKELGIWELLEYLD